MSWLRIRSWVGALLAMLALLYALDSIAAPSLAPVPAAGPARQFFPFFVQPAPVFAAAAQADPQVQYLNDSAGTVFTFTVSNTGLSAGIGAVEISRPASQWTIVACPQAPPGWGAERSDDTCRYRSADGTADDLAAGQTSAAFQLRATTGDGASDLTGTWKIAVSRSNQLDAPGSLTAATANSPGLTVTAYAWQLLDVVVDGTPSAPGGACPAPNRQAIAGSAGHTLVVCGRNRMSVAATPLQGHSSLGGSFSAGGTSFSSGSIAASSASSVVLGTWSNVTIMAAAGIDRTISARIGSSVSQTSPLTTLAGYEATNRPPVAGDDSDAVNEDATLTVAAPGVLANDSDLDGGALTAVLASSPAHGTLALNADGSFTYTPAADYNGPDSFSYKAQDRSGAQSAVATVSIAVNPMNDQPTAGAQSVSTAEDSARVLTLVGSDLDGDSLTFAIVSGPGQGTLGSIGSPSCAAGSCTAGVTYTPAADDSGDDSFTFEVSDGSLVSAAATVSITVTPVDDAPAAVDDAATLPEDAGATAIDVLANDTDVDSGPRSVASVTQPAQGAVVVTGGGTSLTYQPDPNLCNTPLGTPDTFTYTLAPGGSLASVSVSVTCVNDAPVVANAAYSVNEGAALVVAAPGVLAGASDVESDPLTAALVNGPANGALTLNPDGSFSYTPAADYNGPDSFTYRASDGQTASNLATVTLTVEPVNAAPTASAQTATTDQDQAVTIALGGADVESCELTFAIVAGPSNGSLGALTSSACATGSPNSDGASVVYTPANGYNGPDSFTYRVTDGGDGAAGPLASAPATVTITVNRPNAAPAVSPATFTLAENSASGTAVGAVTATDPDAGQTITFAIAAGNSGGAFAINPGTGQITVASSAALDLEAVASFSLTVTATDNGAPPATGSATITVNLTNVNEAPTDIALSNASVAESQPGGTTVGTFTTTDQDAGDSFSYTLAAGAGDTDNAAFTIAGDTLTTAAAFDFEAQSSYSIRVRSTDGGGLFSEKVFTISVTGVNEAPTNLALTPASVTENQPSGTVVGTFSTTDQDAGDSFSYTLAAGAGDTDNAAFTITGGTLTTAAAFDFETRGSYSVRVRSTDGGGLFTERAFTISITDLNEAPSGVALAPADVDENQPAGTTVGAFSTTDQDAGDSFSYTLVAGAGDTDNSSFTIAGSALTTAASFDFETQSSYSIRVRSTDSGGLFFERQLAIAVNNLNDPPALADLELSVLAFTEGDPATAVTAAITVSDPDSATLSSATVSISAGYQSGQDVLAFADQLGITGSFSAATGVLTLSGSATLADYQAALRAVTYANASQNPSTAARTLTFRVNDGAADSNTLSRQLAVAAVNDAPVNSVPGAQTVNEDSDLTFSVANGNAISVADVDVGTASMQVTLTAVNGALTPASGSGATIGGSGTGSVTIAGTLAQVNAALSGLRYRGTLNYNATRGAETLTVFSDDQGNTGAPGALSDSDTVAISVSAVNDQPTAQAQSYGAGSLQANLRRSFVAASGLLVGASDPDTGDGGYTAAFTLGTVNGVAPSGGTITTTIAGVGTISANASTGAFDLDPAPGVTGNVSFSYTVCDSGSPAPAACSATATASLNIAGPVVWFVDDSAPAGGDGRLSSPFNSLAAADGVDGAGQHIFLYTGTYATGIALNAGEWLIGQGVTGASFDALFGITPPTGTLARPGIGGARPTVSGQVTMAGSAAVRGLNITPAAGTGGLSASGATGLAVDEVSVTTTNAVAVNLVNADGSFSFTRIDVNGGPNGIVWNNASAATGSFTVTGDGADTSVGGNGSGGAITNITGANGAVAGTGVYLNNARNVALRRMTLTGSQNFAIQGLGVSGLTLEYATVGGANGNDAAFAEGSIFLANAGGAITITNANISGGFEDNLRVRYDSAAGPAAVFNVTGTTFRDLQGTGGNAQVNLGSTTTAASGWNVSFTFTSCTFENDANTQPPGSGTENWSDGVLVTFEGPFQHAVNVHSSTFRNLFQGMDLASGFSADVNYVLRNNTISFTDGVAAIAMGSASTSTAQSFISALVQDSTIGISGVAQSGNRLGLGIVLDMRGEETAQVTMHGNTIQRTELNGIQVIGQTAADGNLDLQLTSNTVREIEDDAGAGAGVVYGIEVTTNSSPATSHDICLDARSNDSFNINAFDIRVRQSNALVTFALEGFTGNGTLAGDVQAFLAAQNPGNTTNVRTGGSVVNYTSVPSCTTPATQ